MIKDDVLGDGFKSLKIDIADDKDGKQDATLVFRKCKKESKKAILYVHGFIDYFFHPELATHFNDWGYNFYAVDLRKYGRSLQEHHHPNFISNIHQYFEEIDKSIAIIKSDGNTNITLMGHSTGGLTTSLYAHHHNNIDALILNSPFFEINGSPATIVLSDIIASFGGIFPYGKMSGLSTLYPESLHKNHKGEWDFNLNWKPIDNFPSYFGWLKAIRRAQKELQSGLDIKCPVLVMYSNKSYKGKKWSDEIFTSDAVLDVVHIAKYAKNIGANITEVEIKNGIHDLMLSKKEVRAVAYKEMKIWIDNL